MKTSRLATSHTLQPILVTPVVIPHHHPGRYLLSNRPGGFLKRCLRYLSNAMRNASGYPKTHQASHRVHECRFASSTMPLLDRAPRFQRHYSHPSGGCRSEGMRGVFIIRTMVATFVMSSLGSTLILLVRMRRISSLPSWSGGPMNKIRSRRPGRIRAESLEQEGNFKRQD